jgi:hypothetical protein
VKNAIIGELEARDQLSLGAKEGCTYIVDSRVKMKVAITSSAERADHDEGIEAKKLQTLSTTVHDHKRSLGQTWSSPTWECPEARRPRRWWRACACAATRQRRMPR